MLGKMCCLQKSADEKLVNVFGALLSHPSFFTSAGQSWPITVAFLAHKCPSAVQGDLERARCNAVTVMNARPSTTEAFPSDGCSAGPAHVFVCLFGWLGGGGLGRRGAGQDKVPPATL